MKTFWTPYISDHTVRAICWTLIHSLWIGLAVALLAGLAISVTRKSSAALRYNLLCGILLLFTLSASITFCIEMWTPGTQQGPFHVGQIIHAPDNHIIIIPVATQHISFIDRMVMFLNEYSNIIFMAWLLFFMLKSLKMAGGLLYIQRIRTYKVHEVADELKHKIEMFAGQIGIGRTVRLVQSELVKVPVAVGWLKPVILLPIGIILQLSQEQLESILWHELAHIRRRDYLVNILQGLVETVFFFNPGLLWLSSLIRAEREACCDDMVLSRMNRKANYLEALLAFGNEDNSHIPLAMGIGSGNQMRDRLKRMIDKENKRLNMAEKVVLIIGLVALSAFTELPKATTQAVKHLVNVMIKKPGHKVASKTITIDSLKNQPLTSQKTKFVVVDTVHGKADTLVRFKSVLFKHSDADPANNDISAMDEKGIKYHFIVADNKLVAMEINGEKVKDSDLANYQYMIKLIDDEVAAKRHFREQEGLYAKLRADNFDKRRYIDTIQAKSSNGKFKGDDMRAMSSKLEGMRQRWHNDSINYAEQKDRALNVIADLVHDKVLADPASIKWFGLSDTEFIVNGQKQPDEIQQRYKSKYGVHEGWGLYYGPVQMTGRGVFIDVADFRPPLLPRPRMPKEQREPRSGYAHPKNVDTNALKNYQLIKQQQAFTAEEGKKREEIMRQQQFLLAEQQKRQGGNVQEYKARFSGMRIELQNIMANVTDDLVSANVLSDKNELVKFNLTNAALMVNGKKQPEELHEKLKAKYLEQPNYKFDPGFMANPNFGLHYNTQNGDMVLGITSGPDSP